MSTKRLHTNNVSFKIYIKKVLKAVHPSMRITSDALHQLNAVLNYIAEDVAREANSLADSKGKKTLKAREVAAAADLIFPGELAKHARSESTKAITKYNSTNKGIRANTSDRSGLQFGPSRARQFFTLYKKRVSMLAAIALTASLEYIASELLELSGNSARDNKRQSIMVRDLKNVIGHDEELNKMFFSLKINLQGGGVIPHIHSSLLPKSKMTKGGNKIPVPTRRGGRNLPGVVSLRKIREIQKMSGCTHIPKQSFKRLVREIMGEFTDDLSIDPGALNAIQFDLEQYVVDLLHHSNHVAINSGRAILQVKDIELARYIRGDRM